MDGKIRLQGALALTTLALLLACGDDAAPAGDGGIAGGDGAAGDGGAGDDGGPGIDGGPEIDGGTGVDGGAGSCACDVTSLCDEPCSCDVACTAVPGDPPLGEVGVLMNRAEVALYFAGTSAGPIDRVTVRDDAWDPDPDSTLAMTVTPPASPYAELSAPAIRPAIASHPASIGADVDGDGKDEVVLVTPTEMIVEDWSGTALVPRSVATWPMADRVDVAVGDLDGDGAIEVSVLRIAGTTATVAIYSVPETGTAAMIASATRASVDRGAIDVGDTNGDGVDELVLVYAEAPTLTSDFRRIYWASYLHDGTTTLAGGVAIHTGVGCEGTAAEIADEGGDALVADLDTDGTDEIVIAFTCRDADTDVFLWDPSPTVLSSLKGPLDLAGSSDLLDALALRPTLARARIRGASEAPGSILPGRIAVAWTTQVTLPSAPPQPVVRVGILEYREELFTTPLREIASETLPWPGASAHASPTVVTADVDLDADDEILIAADRVRVETVSFCPVPPCELTVTHLGTSVWAIDPVGFGLRGYATVIESAFSGAALEGLGPGPALVPGDFDGDGLRVRRTGEILLRQSPPHVNAVLAAPPTWLGADGVVQAGDSGTSFGTSDTSSMASSQQIGASASATISAEGSYLDIVEVRASVSVSAEYTVGMTTERSISVGTETSTGADSDLVIYRTTPYASHVYEVISHPDAAVVGQHITIDVPGALVETAQDLAGFRADFGSLADELVPPSLFDHSLGDPLSYLPPAACDEGALDTMLGATGDASDVFRTDTVDVGNSPSGSTSRFVTFGEQTSRSTELTLGVELSAGVSVGGVGLDVTAGISTSWTHETTVGSDVTYTGAVGHIADPHYTATTRYRWGLCVFHYTSADGRAGYPVVTYVVDGT